jgi:hypothetical protein
MWPSDEEAQASVGKEARGFTYIFTRDALLKYLIR